MKELKMTETLNNVLQLVVQGYTNRAIANELHFTEHTIKEYVKKLLRLYNIEYDETRHINSRILLVKKYCLEHRDLL